MAFNFWQWIQQILVRPIQPPVPVSQPVPSPGPVPPVTNDVLTQMLVLHNNARAKAGVNPLVFAQPLVQIAGSHAQWMRTYVFSHMEGNLSPFDRMRNAGYRYQAAGENIFEGYADPTQAFAAWMNSPPHRENIMNPAFTEVGFGCAGVFWCADFGSPMPNHKLLLNAPAFVAGALRKS